MHSSNFATMYRPSEHFIRLDCIFHKGKAVLAVARMVQRAALDLRIEGGEVAESFDLRMPRRASFFKHLLAVSVGGNALLDHKDESLGASAPVARRGLADHALCQ